MVGSGFSKSALKTRPDAAELPMWHELALQMNNKLYPPSDQRRVNDDSTEAISTSHFLNLAQEYETAFGRSDLHHFLQQQIRDEDFRPAESHFRLLRLPWHDVFTTNWDTLLERARAHVEDRPYSVIRDMNEIPLAHRPRIVKLHGSLPAQYPLIFTEEDYRTYPTRFAPLVNTVQQAMMETVFCLIGFSANDPNFLKWSGWVRDNLRTSAPKIYLAGWFDLSPHRRRMLEEREVVPIDLARHPKAREWPEPLRHRYATEWLLHTLERGRPYDVTNWPSPSSHKGPAIRDCLQPVMEVTSEQPREESTAPREISPSDLQDSVRDTLKIWKHNRMLYPGWIVLPAGESRSTLKMRTDSWEHHILKSLSSLSPVERLNSVRELIWRRELLLDPISEDLESAADRTLVSVNCQDRTIDEIADSQVDWNAVREAWRTVALALITPARFRFQLDLFTKRIQALEPFVNDDPDVENRIHHERCLWAMYSLDFEALHGLLEDWTVEDCDSIWMIRKAALLWESNRNDEASDLVKHGLNAIHSTLGVEHDIASASREGWALWSAINADNRQEIRKRWNELAALNCDANLERDLIARNLRESSASEDAPAFDLGVMRVQGLSYSAVWPEHLAFRAIRFTEVCGIPPATNHHDSVGTNIASDILKLSAEKLAASLPEVAIRVLMRVCNYDRDKSLMRILTRTRVAMLPIAIVDKHVQICTGVIEYVLSSRLLSRTPGPSVFWIERMRVAMEVLSRLVLRLPPETAGFVFNLALECYRNHQVSREPLLGKSVGNLLQRSWESLPESSRSCRFIDLLGAPIVGMDDFGATTGLPYPDAAASLGSDDSPVRRAPERTDRWDETIDLLIRGLGGTEESRRRAATRILKMAERGLLTEDESSKVAPVLWSAKYTSSDNLPTGTTLADWAFVVLPEPTPGLADRLFRRKWLSGDVARFQDSEEADGNTISVSLGEWPTNPNKIDHVLWNVGIAISNLRNRGRSFELTNDEHEYVVDLVQQWANINIRLFPIPFFQVAALDSTLWALQGLASILAECDVPTPVGECLFEKVKSMDTSGAPGFEIIGGLVKTIPDQIDELITWIRMGLVSDDSALSMSAIAGLQTWLSASSEANQSLPPPPDDLLHEVGFMIASRRTSPLPAALRLATWVFNEGTSDHRKTIRSLAIQGLSYMAEELRYDREPASDGTIDLPLLRWLCVQLAQAMAQSGCGDEPVVDVWLEFGREDPLPEVRNAAMPLAHRETELS